MSYYCHYCHISITYYHRLPLSALRLALAEELRPGEAEFIGQSADAKVREAPEKNWMRRKIYINLGALIYIYIYMIYIYCVFPDIHLQTCMLRCLGRAVAYPYRLRKTQGVTVCAKGRGSPLHGCWPGTPLNREV